MKLDQRKSKKENPTVFCTSINNSPNTHTGDRKFAQSLIYSTKCTFKNDILNTKKKSFRQ